MSQEQACCLIYKKFWVYKKGVVIVLRHVVTKVAHLSVWCHSFTNYILLYHHLSPLNVPFQLRIVSMYSEGLYKMT